ncbi:MAG: 6-phosphofructokinase [Planctomycetes bacterium]|nr:6-phosphofructokinase [Planctomycetota bacterium]MCP4771058.1 6-phosphofructokinase [Planctomycetota bacterium]MCP4861925.1 6-phosphofructokinase [Planctomycetota bacterium]
MSEILKGAAVIGQSGGPTVVINQSLVGFIEAAVEADAITKVYGARHGIAGMMKGDLVDLGAEDKVTLDAIANVPAAALGSVRMKPVAEDIAVAIETFKKFDIRYFFYIGGNDTAETANIMEQQTRAMGYEMRCFHIPKTIDNDLKVTDHCPGYGSAARFVAHAFQGDDRDNRSLPGVKINVVMGRHAGWLTAASALGRRNETDGPHLIYLPERVFDPKAFVQQVEEVYNRLGRCIVAVSEGIHNEAGDPFLQVYAEMAGSAMAGMKDSHGNVQLSGTGALGDSLANLVKEHMGGIRVRADTFGYLQRSFPADASPIDRIEAREVGRRAVEAATSGEFTSGSVALKREEGSDYRCTTFITPLDTVAKYTKDMPEDFLGKSEGITQAFLDYALPLTGGIEPMTDLAMIQE